MLRFPSAIAFLLTLAVLTASIHTAEGARPSDTLLPNTTKGYLSAQDVDELKARFNATQLGHLMNDPVMQPFVKDLRRQMKAKLEKGGIRLGMTLEDLDGVYGGEAAFAAIQPDNNPKAHAAVILVDVTGKLKEANELLGKVARDLKANGGKQSSMMINNVSVMAFTMPKKEGETKASRSFYAIHEDQLIAADHEQEFRNILGRFKGEHKNTLSTVPGYIAAMERCRAEAGAMTPHARWYAEPFGFAEVSRAANGGRKKRGTDMLKVLSNQGFRGIKGLGGYVVFDTADHELLHYTFVYTPDEFKLAARMMDFPTANDLHAQSWIPRSCAAFLTFKWNMKDAFEHSKTLVNEIADDEIFEEVLKSIKHDPAGPQIDIRKDLVAHLSDTATLVTDYRLPITTKSERLMFAIALENADVVKRTVDKAMEHDPEARKLEYDGQVIWEILNEEDEDIEAPVVDNVPGFGGGFEDEPAEDEEEKRVLPNSAVTVAHGHLIVASHVDYIRDVLKNIKNGRESLQFDGLSDRQ